PGEQPRQQVIGVEREEPEASQPPGLHAGEEAEVRRQHEGAESAREAVGDEERGDWQRRAESDRNWRRPGGPDESARGAERENGDIPECEGEPDELLNGHDSLLFALTIIT